MEWYLTVLRKYADFGGRARPMEYWMFTLINLVIAIGLGMVNSIIFRGSPWLPLLYGLAILIPSVAVTVRRLHDTNRSGFWIFISVIPVIGSLILLVLLILPGDEMSNRFGESPLSPWSD